MKPSYLAVLIALALPACDPPTNQASAEEATTSQPTTCDVSSLTVGSCLQFAGFDGSPERRPLSTLMMNGNFTLGSHLDNGTCYADIVVDGMYEGNSYKKKFSCRVIK